MSAALLRKMREMGLSMDQAIELMEAWEEGCAQPMPQVDVAAERRRAKDRERKRNVRGISAESPRTDAKDVSPTPPSETNPSPPLKGGISPKSEAAQPEKPKQKSLQAWTSEIWDQAPLVARRRSGQREAENALKAAVRRGADPARIKAGLAAYYASRDATKDDGEYAKGLHRAIQTDLWLSFEPEPETPVETEDPWPRRLLNFGRNGYWDSDWGPKPGKPGYLGPPQDLAA